jgi:hypothetical protein
MEFNGLGELGSGLELTIATPAPAGIDLNSFGSSKLANKSYMHTPVFFMKLDAHACCSKKKIDAGACSDPFQLCYSISFVLGSIDAVMME